MMGYAVGHASVKSSASAVVPLASLYGIVYVSDFLTTIPTSKF